ncbi:MAG: radical SAM protein, partial [Saprospiraceae bacterium]
GLEVASDRLLQLIAKGVTVEQVSVVTNHFNRAGIMVHAYLMYGFPTQTAQETIDSLEVVRQMFEEDILQSAFWHRFAMTAHSPVGLYPEQFNVTSLTPELGAFANNDLVHADPGGAQHDEFRSGLNKSLYNFMHGICLDHPLQNWFEHKVPETTLQPDLISSYLEKPNGREIKSSQQILWIGGPVAYSTSRRSLIINTKQKTLHIACPEAQGQWLVVVLEVMAPQQYSSFTYQMLQASYEQQQFDDFTLFWFGSVMEKLKEIGLLVF